jgi:hypothetical protein
MLGAQHVDASRADARQPLGALWLAVAGASQVPGLGKRRGNSAGMRTLMQVAIEKVRLGETTPEEVAAAIKSDDVAHCPVCGGMLDEHGGCAACDGPRPAAATAPAPASAVATDDHLVRLQYGKAVGGGALLATAVRALSAAGGLDEAAAQDIELAVAETCALAADADGAGEPHRGRPGAVGQGATADLNLAAVGLEADERGRLRVDADYRTAVAHVCAVGDVIGFPALASTSMEQGRVAAARLYGAPCDAMLEVLPYGIYAIPEIATVGRSEEALTCDGVAYETGVAQYREIARGQLLGDEIGMLKLLIQQDTHAVLGAHAIGTGATELIHIAQAVMALGGTADYFVDAVFNYPTLAECYRVAALNGLNKLRNA